MRIRALCCFAALVACPALYAQQQVLLRHRPGFDKRMHVLFQSVARVERVGGTVLEVADLGAFSGTSLAGREGALVWHLVYDSLRVRTRDSGGTWREFRVPDAASSWAQVHLDERMRVVNVEQRSPSVGLTDPVGVLTGAPGLVLPAATLRLGDVRSSEMRGSLTGGLSAWKDLPELPTLSLAVEMTVDSLIVRSVDTLTYISLSGQVVPVSMVRVTGDDPGRFNLSGDVSASLVWSSGWSLFVSGATRVRVRLERAGEGEGHADVATMNVVKTTRYQLQP